MTTPLGPGPEFDRIRLIERALGSLATGLGDDCAFLPGGWCASTDVSVENVHFRRGWIDPEAIGWRAASGALSDLAAVGARAESVLVGLVAPADEPAEALAAMMRGAGEAAASVGARIVGGDLTAGRELVLAVTVMGRAPHPVRRAGARPGDGIWVTGMLGGARAALLALLDGRAADPRALGRFARPMARVAQGEALAAAGARAMIDVSDGLAGELGHLGAASAVGVEMDGGLIPIHPSVFVEAARAGEPPAVFAAQGGEDYELVAAMPPDYSATEVAGVPITKIGVVVPGTGVRCRVEGRITVVGGFNHFA